MSRHVDEFLTAYVHHELHGRELEMVELHLKDCRECREELRRVRDVTELLCSAKALRSHDAWSEIDRQLSERRKSPPLLRYALAGVVALALGSFYLSRPRDVIPVDGSTLQAGQSVKTGAAGARFAVADIGEIELRPNSEATLLASGPNEHRLRLSKGELSAHVVAPPRLFVIETPTADAVDLGCAYTLKVDELGDTVLKVTSGWVALERDGTDSVVPAGWSCRTRKGVGIGTPVCGSAPQAFREALAEYDASKTCVSLEKALRLARQEDALSLWHLLARTEGHREQVFASLARRVKPPKHVRQADVLALKRDALESWREEIVHGGLSSSPLPFGLTLPEG